MRIDRQLPAVIDDGLLPVVEPQSLGVLARIDQEPPKEGRADQAIRPRRDGVGEERGRRSPRNGTTSSRRSYQVISACKATGERASVRFMFVTRPCAARISSRAA